MGYTEETRAEAAADIDRRGDAGEERPEKGAVSTAAPRERAVLMGIESEESLEELARLTETAGAEVAGSFLQKRDKPDNATLIGSGRLEQLRRECEELRADVCIFDEELTGIQCRNLEQALHIRVLDRTMLILDIFAMRASSAEGKLQVETALLQYRSARLTGQGIMLSRQGGGIGTRGPGESKLEMNRRQIRERIAELNGRIAELEKQRGERRKAREKNGVPTVALVGYTNAGKSTLLNALTGSDVYVKDELFATLDAVSRRMETPEKTEYLLVDTVGFIRKLPHTLIKAFKSTLEEAALADVLVIVSDGARQDMDRQHRTVESVLEELGAVRQKRIEVINKCDDAAPNVVIPCALPISAKTGEGLDELKKRIAEAIQETVRPAVITVPFDRYAVLNELHAQGRVLKETHTETGTEVTVLLSARDRERILSHLSRPR